MFLKNQHGAPSFWFFKTSSIPVTFYEDCMSKQERGKMRRTHWRLTIIPLVVLSVATLCYMPVYATGEVHANSNALQAIAAMVRDKALGAQTLTIAAQVTVTPTITATPTKSALVLPRLTPVATATAVVSSTLPLSATTPLSAPSILSDTVSEPLSTSVAITAMPSATVTAGITATNAVTTDATLLDAEYAGPIEGTIIANRTEVQVRFFVEGATYELAPLRSIGLALPRVTAVLNLFNCDATLPESQDGCFWDPYLLDRESFYEVIGGQDTGLTLQAAGTPPANQIWLQNRTGKREQVFYAGATYELPPSTVQEFTTETADTPAILYLRSCLEVTDRTVCEWAPNDAKPGFYYALVEVTVSGAVPDSQVNALELQPIIVSGGGELVETPAQITCQLQVPVLNVRSGPGLQYQIISKVRSTEQAPATVLVIGRDTASEWFAVDDRVAPGGWVTGSSGFVTCTGDTNTLPVVEVTDGRLAPTPVAAAPAEDTTTTDSGESTTVAPVETTPAEAEPVAEITPTAAALTVPPGQALIIIHNGFDQQIRFTLDQRYRVEVGPSEYDLLPGQAVSLLVYPGQLAFSASTPWRGISGNDDLLIEAEQARDLWITFVPDPDGSGRWILQF